MIEFIVTDKEIDTRQPVVAKTRTEATPTNAYNHEADRVPYMYGVYGDDDGAEQQGLIKGSTGLIMSQLAKEHTDYKKELEAGYIPSDLRYLLDAHTVPVKDGNCAVPVGLHDYDLDENGEIINSKIWYGAATPKGYVNYLINEHTNAFNLKNGTNYGLYQESEKEDNAVSLSFTDLPVADKTGIAGTYDRAATGKTSVAFGSSMAVGGRSFAAGSSNVAKGDKSIALGCDNYAATNQSIAIGYANYSAGASSVALGHCNSSTGIASFASGTQCKASGNAATAFGTGSIASGVYSFAAGNQSKAGYENQFIVGKFNNNSADTFFEVGNGSNDTNRSTAFAVTRDGAIRIGSTSLTEAQLKKLIALI